MSLVFASIVPHPLVLVPQIGKEHIARLSTTKKSYEKLAGEFAASKANTIIIISPHGLIQENAFTMNLNPEYNANFEEFGDFSTKFKIKSNIGLAYKIREKLETKVKLQLISDSDLDYGSSVPLYLLAGNIPKIKIIPFSYSGLSADAHFEFGKLLNNEILKAHDNIGVIASGDLSHRLTKNAPGGFSPKAKKFDAKVIESLLENKPADLIKLDDKILKEEIMECGLNSILVLLGILDGISHEPQLLSYEAPFGVGYMVMNFKL